MDPGPRYVLGLNLLRLGDLVGQQTSIAELGLPTLRELTSVTGLTSRLAMNENGYPVFLERIDGEGSIRFHAPLGQREEPHATAAGKAILAEMNEQQVRDLIAEAGMAVHTSKTLTDVSALSRTSNAFAPRGTPLTTKKRPKEYFASVRHSSITRASAPARSASRDSRSTCRCARCSDSVAS